MALKQGNYILAFRHFWNQRLIGMKELPFCRTFIGYNKYLRTLTVMRNFSLETRRKGANDNSFGKSANAVQFQLVTKAIQDFRNKFSMNDIETLKEAVLTQGKNISEINFDAIFITLCGNEKAFDLGKSYFDYLYSKGNRNIGMIGKFFRLCYDCKEECSETEKSLMDSLYKQLIMKYEILDFKTCENLALGLSIGHEWKECLKLLDMARFTTVPSSKMYSAIIEAAFSNNEVQLGLNLMHRMVSERLTPFPDVYISWLNAFDSSKDAFTDLFKFFEKYDLHISEKVAQLLLSHYNKHQKKAKFSKITTINKSGKCQTCFRPLNPIIVSETEFKKMKDAFLDPVLIGKDIFYKTKPEEFKSFINFLERIEHTDIVLDGLNIALSPTHRNQNTKLSAQVLCNVVKHFLNLSKKVMVLGRKHMTFWPKHYMNYIKQNASLFLVENESTDDPYLLYATMYFGLGTAFVSRDQMRGHKFLLQDPELMSIFSKWQQKHQYYFLYASSKDGKVSLMEPMKYSQCVQQTKEGIWHIPLSTDMAGIPAHLIPIKKKWLCFQDN